MLVQHNDYFAKLIKTLQYTILEIWLQKSKTEKVHKTQEISQ